MVLVHARALLTSAPEGATDYARSDITDPASIPAGARRTLDLDRPVAVMLLGILNFVLDTDEAAAIVRRLTAAVPSGSYLALTHPTVELGGEANVAAMEFWNANAAPPIRARTGAGRSRILDALELVAPGLVACARGRPADGAGPTIAPEYG